MINNIKELEVKYYERENNEFKKNNIGMAILINIIVLFTCIFIFNPVFETNDDSAMAEIAYGVYGGYSSHLVFINALIGKGLMILLTFFRLYHGMGSVSFLLFF